MKIIKYIVFTTIFFTILTLVGCKIDISKEQLELVDDHQSKTKQGINVLEVAEEKIKLLEGKEDINFSSEVKDSLIEKYVIEAWGSDFYWQSLSEEISELKTLNPDIKTIEFINLKEFIETGYGILILSSVPTGAYVYLERHIPKYQGKTTIKKGYSEKSYTFKLKKEGYIPKDTNITIIAKDTIEVEVTLEKK